MVPLRQTVELLVSQKVILQERLRKLWMRKAIADADEWDERCAKVGEGIVVGYIHILMERQWLG